MSEDTTTIPTWGYKPDGSAQIFTLVPGAMLPEGWHASPAVIIDPAFATAEALSARAAGRAPEVPVLAVHELPSAQRESAMAVEVERLQAIMATGLAENQSLYERLDAAEAELAPLRAKVEAAEAELDAAAKDIIGLRAALGDAGTAKDEALAAVERLTADLDAARADLDAATKPAGTVETAKPSDKPKNGR